MCNFKSAILKIATFTTFITTINGASRYFISTFQTPFRTTNQAYPINVCVNYEDMLSASENKYGRYVCNQGGSVTFNDYGKGDSTCLGIPATTNYYTSATDPELNSFNCDGEDNYVITDACKVSSNVNVAADCCAENSNTTECLPSIQAVDVCVKQTDNTYFMVSCGAISTQTISYGTSPQCWPAAAISPAEDVSVIDSCDFYENVQNVYDIYTRLNTCYKNGKAISTDTFCGNRGTGTGTATDFVAFEDSQYGLIVSSILFVVKIVLVLFLSIYVYLTGDHKNIVEFAKALYKRKWMYFDVTAHLYDTASDIGVLIDWYILAYDDNEYSINMMAMFWASVAFQLLYRFLLCGFTTVRFGYQPEDDETESCGGCMVSIGWAWTDMEMIRTVYKSLKYGETEANARQDSIGIIEAVSESAPEIILQCIFLSRAYSDPILSESGSSTMVIISLVFSIFEITKQYAEIDSASVVEGAKELGCVNINYILRILWRFSFLLARMFLLVSVWLVLGGPIFGVFLCVSTMIWCCCLCRLTDTGNCYGDGNYYVCCVACIANPITKDKKVNCYHFFEMITWMIIITILGFTNNLQLYDDNCGALCADQVDRIATGNPYAEGFIIIAWIALVVDIILFCILYHTDQFEDNQLDEIFQVFIDGQTYSPGKVKVNQKNVNQAIENNQAISRDEDEVELEVNQQTI